MSLLRLFTGPKLYWTYVSNSAFQPNFAETWGQSFVSWVKFLAELSLYTSPIWIFYYGRPLESARHNFRFMGQIAMGASLFYFIGLILRAYGRMTNPVYMEFLRVLGQPNNRAHLEKYDFEFWAWPSDFRALKNPQMHFVPREEFGLFHLPHRMLGYAMINTFGLKLLYPGSTKWLLQAILGPALAEQRAQLVTKYHGQRIKLSTDDGNDIDSMFFDKRSSGSNGKNLVIVCEGNAGFYEIGMLTTPLNAGFSVMGWNHPGFYGSTGSPFPEQDAHAADAVMQYATKVLKFPVENVLVYGWSIGGFPASWLAMNYPQMRGLILDASFDHISPLAVPRMPAVLGNVVKITMNYNVNLDVGKQLIKYKGPVRLVKRTKDEMISTNDDNIMESNRGNNLLVMLLSNRYPNLFDKETESFLCTFLSTDKATQESLMNSLDVSESELLPLIKTRGNDLGLELNAEEKKKLLMFLATMYRTEYDATHNVPLPVELFQLPWELATSS